MTLKELEARIQTIEDVEAIKKLQRAYGYYLEHWQTEECIGLFSESPDVSVEVSEAGLYKGKEGVRKFFSYPDHYDTQETKPPPGVPTHTDAAFGYCRRGSGRQNGEGEMVWFRLYKNLR